MFSGEGFVPPHRATAEATPATRAELDRILGPDRRPALDNKERGWSHGSQLCAASDAIGSQPPLIAPRAGLLRKGEVDRGHCVQVCGGEQRDLQIVLVDEQFDLGAP